MADRANKQRPRKVRFQPYPTPKRTQKSTGKAIRTMLIGNPTRPTPRVNADSDDEDYDAASDEGVRGLLSPTYLSSWSRSVTQFIHSNAGLPGAPPDVWVGKRPLGKGGFGLAGLWEKKDGAGKVVDRVVIKQIGTGPQGAHAWDPHMPQEVKIMKDLNQIGCPGIVEFKGYKRYIKDSVHRIYMEYCPHGDLRQLAIRYRRYRKYLPETFLWDLFYYLTQACDAMATGPAVPTWDFEIVHRDIKPENVFLGVETNDDFPFYPTPKLGDYGLAVKTNSFDRDNPHRLVGTGTHGYLAPEQKPRRDDPWYLRGNQGKLSAHTNIWAMGVVMYELLTLHRVNTALFVTEVDPDGGVEGLKEIHTSKNPEYSDLLRTLIMECLRPNPKERPTVEEVQIRIDIARRHMADVGFTRRGNDKTIPHPDERLYYRGKEIEPMQPGDWVPSKGGRENPYRRESGFPNPCKSALMITVRDDETSSSPSDDDEIVMEEVKLMDEVKRLINVGYPSGSSDQVMMDYLNYAANGPLGVDDAVTIMDENITMASGSALPDVSVPPPPNPAAGVNPRSRTTGDMLDASTLSAPKGRFCANKYGRAAI